MMFFSMLELTAIDYCRLTGDIQKDLEFERVYRQLRRRPDGTDVNPMFSYLQAAARVCMSLRDTSRAEFEAVAQRLSLSASRFSEGVSSSNYFRIVSGNIER